MQVRTAAMTAVMVACGDIGQRFAAGLNPEDWRRVGVRRSVHRLPTELEPLQLDLTQGGTLGALRELRPDVLLFTPTPTERSTTGYEQGFALAAGNIARSLGDHSPSLALMVSSTRVYAQSTGAWVDESASLNRDDPAARAIIEAEDSFLNAFDNAVILRAGGLYADAPGFLLRRVSTGQLTAAEPARYSNRIHRDDLVGFMHWLLDNNSCDERVFNLVDSACVTQQEVERWLCEQLGRAWEPPGVATSGPARGHKRVSNQRLLATGYQLRYPDYRTGYGEVLRNWRLSQGEDSLNFN
jgi:nucleoside-diphosphate-sugar epimerase